MQKNPYKIGDKVFCVTYPHVGYEPLTVTRVLATGVLAKMSRDKAEYGLTLSDIMPLNEHRNAAIENLRTMKNDWQREERRLFGKTPHQN